MKKGSMGQIVRSHITILLFVSFLGIFAVARTVHAQGAAYSCLSGGGVMYWSSQPCLPGQSAQNYYGNPYPPAQYQQNYYPYNYYPNNNYQYSGYGYQNYFRPTCSIGYSVTHNPNYWSGGMYAQAIQISWSSNYATSAYISGIGEVSPSGISVVYPYGYMDYTMTVYGPGGNSTCRTYYQPAGYYPGWQQSSWQQIGYTYGNYYGY